MAANHRYVQLFRLFAFQFRDEGVGTDDVQRCDTKQFVFVVHTRFLQHFCRNGHRGIHRVGDDTDAGFRAGFSHLLNQVAYDASVNVEQIGTIHPWFTRNASRNQHHVRTVQRRSCIFATEAFDFNCGWDVA
ncbi:hypothetical protein D3C80_1757450 [compost metagenome]